MKAHQCLAHARKHLRTAPSQARAAAEAAVTLLDHDDDALAVAVIVLAELLDEDHAAVADLCARYATRFPKHLELHFRRALALQGLGRVEEMFDAYERCLALGITGSSHAHTAGAGTYLAYHQLALFAERHGDARAARKLYERALGFAAHEPSVDRLMFLAAVASHVREARSQH